MVKPIGDRERAPFPQAAMQQGGDEWKKFAG
jgi:hypothetical protein